MLHDLNHKDYEGQYICFSLNYKNKWINKSIKMGHKNKKSALSHCSSCHSLHLQFEFVTMQEQLAQNSSVLTNKY